MQQGRRVLCVAQRSIRADEVPADGKFYGTGEADCSFGLSGFEFLGFFSIDDPPRPGVAEAVEEAKAAGIKVVMVTGDHPGTARSVAHRLNILGSKEDLEEGQDLAVIEGTQLEAMMPENGDFSEGLSYEVRSFWNRAVVETRVFARVTPLHKQIIVKAFQALGHGGIGDIVAMTGDGVNDAPAMKQAEVGIAMGIRGTEVAKDAADIILLDDDFSSALVGIEKGRLASENLQKSIMYTLCSKVAQVAPAFGELFGVPEALASQHILLIDIGTDIWTAVAYAMQPAESSLMERKPRHPRLEQMANKKVFFYSYGYMGVLQTIFCWAMYYLVTPGIHGFIGRHHKLKDMSLHTPEDMVIHEQSMTVYYWTLVLGQVAAAISTTTKVQRISGAGGYGLPNRLLNVTVVMEIVFSLFVMYSPFFQDLFHFATLPWYSLLVPIVTLVAIFGIEEFRKHRGWML